jgi:hypothetical protein
MKTKVEKMQDFVRHYRDQTGKDSVTMQEVAEYARQHGWALPKPKSAIELLAAQFSDSLRAEVRKDSVTGRPYRANLAVSDWQGNTQMVLWTDIEIAKRAVAHKSLTQYREQMIGEAVHMSDTADHWNRINPTEEPIVMMLDFNDDVTWRRNAPMDDEKAA